MLRNQQLPQALFLGALIWYYQIRMAFLTPKKHWIHIVWNMEHNFGTYLSVNFTSVWDQTTLQDCGLLSIHVPYCWGVRKSSSLTLVNHSQRASD